jgi:hypothetical protein
LRIEKSVLDRSKGKSVLQFRDRNKTIKLPKTIITFHCPCIFRPAVPA